MSWKPAVTRICTVLVAPGRPGTDCVEYDRETGSNPRASSQESGCAITASLPPMRTWTKSPFGMPEQARWNWTGPFGSTNEVVRSVWPRSETTPRRSGAPENSERYVIPSLLYAPAGTRSVRSYDATPTLPRSTESASSAGDAGRDHHVVTEPGHLRVPLLAIGCPDRDLDVRAGGPRVELRLVGLRHLDGARPVEGRTVSVRAVGVAERRHRRRRLLPEDHRSRRLGVVRATRQHDRGRAGDQGQGHAHPSRRPGDDGVRRRPAGGRPRSGRPPPGPPRRRRAGRACGGDR